MKLLRLGEHIETNVENRTSGESLEIRDENGHREILELSRSQLKDSSLDRTSFGIGVFICQLFQSCSVS